MYNIAVAACLSGQLLVIYAPPLQSIFQTEALSLGDIIRLIILASTVLWVDEARKWYRQRRHYFSLKGRGYAYGHLPENMV